MSHFVHPTPDEMQLHLRHARASRSDAVCGFISRIVRFVLHRHPDRLPDRHSGRSPDRSAVSAPASLA